MELYHARRFGKSMAGSEPILQVIAAKAPDGTPCCQWVGPAGSGHFVKMIHNGIEYGDMQLIAEAYWVMKNLIDLTNEEMADVFCPLE